MILDTIVAQKQLEVEVLLSQGITYPDFPIDPPRGFKDALIDYPGVSLIAEAKKASPSKGVIRPEFDPVSIGLAYEAGGAQAMSVLTDEKFFQGSLDYIPLIRQEISLPVNRSIISRIVSWIFCGIVASLSMSFLNNGIAWVLFLWAKNPK